jgi:hypothetical protein
MGSGHFKAVQRHGLSREWKYSSGHTLRTRCDEDRRRGRAVRGPRSVKDDSRGTLEVGVARVQRRGIAARGRVHHRVREMEGQPQ